VDYRTTDTDTFTFGCFDTVNNLGSAYGRCDFATVVGTFSFAAGETMKSFDIPIIDDSYHEGNETFTVVLSNPSAAALGTPSTATVTIIDNDLVDGPNPILQTNDAGIAFFVRQHYLDFLGREPEAGEPWSAILRGCADQFNVDPNSPSAACDRITVSGAFFGSPEFKDKGFYVIDFYRVAFGRLPEYSEFVTDLASLVGQTPTEVFARRAAFANNFVQRPEFASIAALPNSSYVMTLMAGTNGQNYNLTSITTPDPASPDGTTKVTLTTNDLINGLNANTLTRAQVLRAIVQSDEIINIEAVSTFVASQYYGYLRRTPEPAGFNSWVNYLTAHPTDFRTMVNGFMNSIEYRLRFGPQ
jgi:Calx-beta domain